MPREPLADRRVTVDLRRRAISLWGGVRPTLVLAGVAQPTQWGRGTWLIPADVPVTIGVYLFVRGWRFGDAQIVVAPSDTGVLVYRAPALPLGAGVLTAQPA